MTNAARFRLAAGPNKRMLEFGLRRAQVCGIDWFKIESCCIDGSHCGDRRVLTVVSRHPNMHTLEDLMQLVMFWPASCSA